MHPTVVGRENAIGFLERHKDQLNVDASLALHALRGDSPALKEHERTFALRFLLGHPADPSGDVEGYGKMEPEEVEASKKMATQVAKHVHVWAASAIAAARAAAVHVVTSSPVSSALWRIRSRSVWMHSRGLREVWEGWSLSRK